MDEGVELEHLEANKGGTEAVAVATSQSRRPFRSPRLMAARASTMATLLMRRTKLLTVVMGMSSTSSVGPERLLPRYMSRVEISAPKEHAVGAEEGPHEQLPVVQGRVEVCSCSSAKCP